MTDLRLFANDLIGRTFTIAGKERFDSAGSRYFCNTKFKIDEVYAHHVTAHFTCDNGEEIREAFSVGDLVQLGILKSGRGYMADGSKTC